jgi:medium-chain acyl-[acyl-carrier-protein] hydrolase
MSSRPAPELDSEWAVRLTGRKPEATKLICFPFAGGSAHVFRTLGTSLEPALEVHAVQLPGRGMRLSQPSLTGVAEIVEALDRELDQLVQGPYALYGTSMGALLAFEWARTRRRAGAREPELLCVVGARPPDRADPGWRMHALPSVQFQTALRRYGGTPEAVLAEPELMELMEPMLRADFTVVECYAHAPEPPLAAPVLALGGADDRVVPVAELSGWERHTRGSYRQLTFPGDHFFHRAPAVEAEIAALVSETLAGRAGG